jgi:hypothetical protein
MQFSDFEAFAAHLLRKSIMVDHVLEAALEASAQIVEDTAKAEFGSYQPRIGPFEAWAELAESTKEERIKLGFTENDPLLRTGHLRSTIEHTVDGLNAAIGSDDDIMVKMELGTGNVPPRAALGPAGMRTEKEIRELVGEAVMSVLQT